MPGSPVEPTAGRFAEALRLAAATTVVLGTAVLAFTLAFRERAEPSASRIRPVADDLLDVTIYDGGKLAAVGHNGRILQSLDGGRTFVHRSSGVATPLAAVFFRNAQIGLAAGYGGVILRTGDGGNTWTATRSGVDVYLTSLRPVSDGILAAGEWATILWSGDDGEHWETRTSRDHDFIVNDVDVDTVSGFGFAVGELGQGLETADGGRTWRPRRLADDETTLFSVEMLSASEAWIAGGASLLLHTRDGGASWQRTALPCSATQLLRVRVAGERGYAVGRRCAVVTEDGGQSWRSSALAAAIPFSWLYGLHVAPEAVWAAGYRQALFRTGGDDRSWQRVAVDHDAR